MISDPHFRDIRVVIIIVGFVISGTVYIQATNKISHLQSLLDDRVLNVTPKLLAALSKDPRAPIHIVINTAEPETERYGKKWQKLLIETGWSPSSFLSNIPDVPRGVTLFIHKGDKAAAYALQLRKILSEHRLPVSVPSPGTPYPLDSKDSNGEVTLLIGNRH